MFIFNNRLKYILVGVLFLCMVGVVFLRKRAFSTTKLLSYFISPTPTSTPTPTLTPTPIPTSTPTPTPTPLPTATPTPSPPTPIPATSFESYFDQYSIQYKVNKDLLKKIAFCESGISPGAKNGPYGGMYQFTIETWQATRKQMGVDANPDLRFGAKEAIETAAFKISRGGESAWKNCL